MSQTATIAALSQFINSQSPRRVIHNDSWSSCVVGDFAREVLNHYIPEEYELMLVDSVIQSLWKDCGSTHDSQLADIWSVEFRGSNAPASFMDMLEMGEFETYGAVQEHLKANA